MDCAPEDFHARHSARLKTYAYQILNRPIRSPLDRLYSWHFPHALDISRMNKAAQSLMGVHDFAAFGSPTDGTPSTVREIVHANWEHGQADGMLCFNIVGTGFLRYMVRSIVGTLVFVGSGKIQPDKFAKILESCDRSQAGPTAPPQGLCLINVDYGLNKGTVPVNPTKCHESYADEEPLDG
jgi:tRNA pseudouridine38-40 synthase